MTVKPVNSEQQLVILIRQCMSPTTLLKKRVSMERKPLAACHDGHGALDWINVVEKKEAGSRKLNFLHDDILKPGVSIGEHRHEHDEEYYYFLSGRGTMMLDGTRCQVEAGDLAAVFPGGTHGLVNDGDEDMRIIVFSVA
jgi:uncharacterized RmlC-like cupin family protein